MAGVFLERNPAGLPRPRSTLVGFCLQVILLDSLTLVLPAPAPLARKTRTPGESPGSGEVTAVFTSLLLPLLPLDSSVESGDGFAASAVSPVVSNPGRGSETSSSPESMLLLLNCNDS